MDTPSKQTRQEIFQELLIGSLLYSVVFGFFNDYTDILSTTSYSVTFFVAVLMMALTFPTFQLKKAIARWFKKREGKRYKVGMVLSVWAVLFFSKFIFLEAIDIVFGDSVYISGFVGLVLIIICATLLQKITTVIYKKLGPTAQELELG